MTPISNAIFKRYVDLTWIGDPNNTVGQVRETLRAEFGEDAIQQALAEISSTENPATSDPAP